METKKKTRGARNVTVALFGMLKTRKLVVLASLLVCVFLVRPPPSDTLQNQVGVRTVIIRAHTNLGDGFNTTAVFSTTRGGHWEFHPEIDSPPYRYSQRMCEATVMHPGDCNEAKCLPNLMNWIYYLRGDDTHKKVYPKFDVTEFRRRMYGKKLLFIGTSLMRQQVEALAWTLGHEHIRWKNDWRPYFGKCTTVRSCFTDTPSKMTICFQFLGSMATHIYSDGNYTLDHSLRPEGDSSCLLSNPMMKRMKRYDVVFVQSLAWYVAIPSVLKSDTCPEAWAETVLPQLYADSMQALLSKLSQSTKTVFVLGHIGTDCANKTEPESYDAEQTPSLYGWNLSPKLSSAALQMIAQDEELRRQVQVVDAREPTMQSVHAHPYPDCLHFCSNSAALNVYLDIYWNEVFSQLEG